VTTLYDGLTRDEWIEELEQFKFWNRKHLYAVWAMFGAPVTMLDIGCGEGDLVEISRNMGVEAYGVDQLIEGHMEPDWLIHADLREPFSLQKEGGPSIVDLVLCWEVAEHIPDENLDIFIDTICNHLKRDEESLLIFTSAHPGQGGKEHATERPAIFWRDQFHIRGLNYQEEYTYRLALIWQSIYSPLMWLPTNVQIFRK